MVIEKLNMRDIKFRGLVLYGNKGWVYGSLHFNSNADLIREYTDVSPCNDAPLGGLFVQDYGIDNKTIGQYTGLKDKNGVEIYEGDVVSVGKNNVIKIVEWEQDQARFAFVNVCDLKDREFCSITQVIRVENLERVEVIGNIYQSPELLEEK